MTTELELPAIIPLTELERINATDEHLTQLIDKANELANVGATDAKSYEQIHDLTMVAVNVRTASLKLAKAQAAPYGEKYDAIMNEGKRIGERARIAENITRPLKLSYEAEQERIKKEAEQAEAARIQSRVLALNLLQAKFNGLTYDVCGVYIDAIEVNKLPEDEFRDLLDSATTAYNAEQLRLANIEAERIAEAERVAAEQKRIADEQEAERKRLQAISDEQMETQRKFDAERAEFQRQQQEAEQANIARLRKIEDDAKQALCTKRIAELEAVGYKRDGGQLFEHGVTQVHVNRIPLFDEEQFQQIIQDAIAYDNRKAQEAIEVKQAADEKKKADKERTKRLAPDKKALSKHIELVANTHFVVLSQPETVNLQIEFEKGLHLLLNEFRAKLEAL